MIVFKSGALYIFTLFLIVILIILWEIGEIESKEITKRGIMDNINNGIRFAGQMFGINNAADVANLVAKAFAPRNFHKSEFPETSINAAEFLNTGETESSFIYQNAKQNEKENIVPAPTTLNTGFMIANMLKLMGLDTSKLGALALNIIIVIAQMIGNTFIQNPNSKIPASEQILDLESRRQSKISDIEYDKEIRNTNIFKSSSPFDWILENPSEELRKILNQIRDEKLPEYFINQINEMEKNNGDGDCIKILICKIQPFFWSMQKQVINRIDGNKNEENENENDNRTDVFYKYLPNMTDFKKHGEACEKKFPNCNFYVRSR